MTKVQIEGRLTILKRAYDTLENACSVLYEYEKEFTLDNIAFGISEHVKESRNFALGLIEHLKNLSPDAGGKNDNE